MIEYFVEGGSVDNAFHVAAAGVSIVLFLVSLRSYLSDRRRRFLYVCAAFLMFAVREALVVSNIVALQSAHLTFVSHLLTVAVLAAFFMGVMRK